MKEDVRAAAAICAALMGAGFASGREIMSFFTQFGRASWVGIAAAGAGITLLLYALLTLSARTDSQSVPLLYERVMNPACGYSMQILYGLLTLTTAAAMLCAGGEASALLLPIGEAYPVGVLMTLALALLMARRGSGVLAGLGGLLAVGMVLCCAGIGGGGRSREALRVHDAALSLPMGLMYAAFNGALAGGTACFAGRRAESPKRCALLCGGMVTLLLCTVNARMLHAPDTLQTLALPLPALAADGGGMLFVVCMLCLVLAILTTMSAMLISLRAQCERLWPNRPALTIVFPAALALLMSCCGFERIVGALYPMLGWVCALAFLALFFFL